MRRRPSEGRRQQPRRRQEAGAARLVVWQTVHCRRGRQAWSVTFVLCWLMPTACSDGSPADPPVASSSTVVTTSSTGAPTPTLTATPQTATTATGPAVVISRGSSARRMVALTFDAGSDTGHAAAILDTLARSGIRATFGLTGKWAEENPDLVIRTSREGHLIVNHTYDHRSFTGVSAKPAVANGQERRDQLARTDAVLTRLTGRSGHPWFRPPYGDYDASVNADVGAAGYRYNVLWTVDSLGWQGLSAAAITTRSLEGAEPGAIYLFHVGAESQDGAALFGIIAGLRERGYEFGTVADVIGD